MFVRQGLHSSSTSLKVCRNNLFDLNSFQKLFISTSGKDARSIYPFFYNKNKQHPKSKEHNAEIERRKAVAAEKRKFKFDGSKSLSEHLKYSEKFHSSRGQRSKRSAIKNRITQFGKAATPTPFMNSTEVDKDGIPIDPELAGHANVDQYLASLDTTLTEEQRTYVNMLKKKMKGAMGIRSLYRDVPRPDEIKGTGNYLPKIAENAEELIDWALSHVPKRNKQLTI